MRLPLHRIIITCLQFVDKNPIDSNLDLSRARLLFFLPSHSIVYSISRETSITIIKKKKKKKYVQNIMENFPTQYPNIDRRYAYTSCENLWILDENPWSFLLRIKNRIDFFEEMEVTNEMERIIQIMDPSINWWFKRFLKKRFREYEQMTIDQRVSWSRDSFFLILSIENTHFFERSNRWII